MKGVKVFYIAKYDMRMPQPRQLISRSYQHIRDHPILSNLFPRENLVGAPKDNPTYLKYCHQLFNPAVGLAQGLHMVEMGLGLVMMGLQMAKWVVSGEGGMAPITAH